jgi:hypothetical protein
LGAARDRETQADSDEGQRKEMTLGLNSFIFQFYHLEVLLSRHDELNPELCLESARNALTVLPRLISTSEQVYNGIIWYVHDVSFSCVVANRRRQLLYYPFNPFFVLFGNIIHAPLSGNASQDVQLLRSTVSYYTEMSIGENSFARKLKGVANVFASLAELYIDDARLRNSLGVGASIRPNVSRYSDSEPIVAAVTSMSDLPFTTEGHNMSTSTFDFDFSAGNNLLNCFTDLDFTSQLDFGGQQSFAASENGNFASLHSAAPNPMAALQFDVFESLEKCRVGSKRPLEYTFDWFAWDLNQ